MIFYLFFKQLTSSSFPKRGIDYEADRENDQIGGITEMEKNFSKPEVLPSRVQQLMDMADSSLHKEDFFEADKAISSALILEPNNIELMLKYGYVLIQLERLDEAKENYLKVIEIDGSEDMAYVSLANVLHKLGEDKEAIEYHKRAIELDSDYAPHYYNYANTLYDMGQKEEALEFYKKALERDETLESAQSMIKELTPAL